MEKYKKLLLKQILLFSIFSFILNFAVSFCLDDMAAKIEVKLISPNKPNSQLFKTKVSTEPILVSGIVPVEIGKCLNINDLKNQRYFIEYFLDGELIYKTDGEDIKDSKSRQFTLFLDTTKYLNGKHKLIVNFWDSKGISSIGIVYIVIENPASIDKIREATSE